jgi:aspartate aminotransferase
LSQILVSSGAKQALYNLCLALLDPEDEAIIPAPYWVSYPDMVLLSDATPVVIATGIEQGFRITAESLAATITTRSRLLFLNSPCNPTGASYSAAEFAALGAVLEKHPRIVIVSDEIYEPISWAETPFVSFAAACPALFDRTVTVNGASKAYAMTGWRIGYAAGPAALIAAMSTIQSQSTSNPCSISQHAAIAALQGDQAIVGTMTAAYRERHDFLVSALNAIPGFECRPGEGTFYAFPRVTGAMKKLGLQSDVDFAKYLVEKADVALVPGSAFGAPGYLRLSFACSIEMLHEAVRRLKRAVAA